VLRKGLRREARDGDIELYGRILGLEAPFVC